MAFTLKQKRAIRRAFKRGYEWKYDELANRHYWRERINACTEDGMIAVYRRGMDCDCTAYEHVTFVPAPVSVLAWLKAEDEHREWLDGPESMSIDKPSDHGDEWHTSRDLALEAFENGHPGRIEW